MVFSFWKFPRILIEFGVRGSPFAPQPSLGCCDAQKVNAPNSAFPSGFMFGQSWALLHEYTNTAGIIWGARTWGNKIKLITKSMHKLPTSQIMRNIGVTTVKLCYVVMLLCSKLFLNSL